jgi:hypothetical protein
LPCYKTALIISTREKILHLLNINRSTEQLALLPNEKPVAALVAKLYEKQKRSIYLAQKIAGNKHLHKEMTNNEIQSNKTH